MPELDEERVRYVKRKYDVSRKCARALQLAELGFSHSGIAKQLDVTEGTAKKYLRQLENSIGEMATETMPKHHTYDTLPFDKLFEELPRTELPTTE